MEPDHRDEGDLTALMVKAWRQGKRDVTAQRGFAPEYDRWPPQVQQHYESGRLEAASGISTTYRP